MALNLDAVHSARKPGRRLTRLDVARGVALVAMAIYHFTWDLEFFGYVPPGMTAAHSRRIRGPR